MDSLEPLAGTSDGLLTVPEPAPERWFKLAFQWNGKSFSMQIAESDRVFDLKAIVQSLTNVPPDRQKILGLVKGKLPSDEVPVADLGLISGKKFSLVGTPEGDEFKDPNLDPDLVNDQDLDFTVLIAERQRYTLDQRNKRKVKEYSDKLVVNIIHPLREGKKLLVLDLDYTILDTKPLTSGSLPPPECARPGLHEFLEAIYPYYDICIWSQTSWIWLETKLVELGMVGGHRNYHISFVLDKTSMFTVFSERVDTKAPWRHSVKALQLIWNHFPQFNATNTIHVDDLASLFPEAYRDLNHLRQGRNFALNPNEGLKISAFKNAGTSSALADRELEKLARYMVRIANVADFRTLSHKDWKTFLRVLQ